MRYWIYWNDLVQGPFELEELVSLHAFDGELLVCLENRQEWLPAKRVAELSPSIELMKTRRTLPPPPPPPPAQPPSTTPLQGEFFSGPQGQQDLFADLNDDPHGLFSYKPVIDGDGLSESADPAVVTMPFRFTGYTFHSGDHPATNPYEKPTGGAVEVLEMPRPSFSMPAPIQESTVRQEIPVEESAPPTAEIPLQLYSPETVPTVQKEVLDESLSTEAPVSAKHWVPWLSGALIILGLLGALGYWMTEHYSSRSAITEVDRRMTEAVTPVAIPMPTPERKPPFTFHPEVLVGRVTDGIAHLYAGAKARFARPTAPVVVPTPIQPPVPARPIPEQLSPKRMGQAISHRAKGVVKKVTVQPVQSVIKAAESSFQKKPAEAPIVPPAVTVPAVAVAPPVVTGPVPSSPKGGNDPWIGRQAEAINLVMNYSLFGGKRTIGTHAKTMLDELHEKELLHAADTGERLYLPDKMAWSSLREEGPWYRVYMNFSALRSAGERVQTNSYQFRVNLQAKDVISDDSAARQDFLQATIPAKHAQNPMVNDIESILSAVDLLNKHKLHSMIRSRAHISKTEKKNMQQTLEAAQSKVHRSIVYFRTKYPEKMLQNVAKAYLFSSLLK